MMGTMFTDEATIECATCPATGTTACGDCVVTHLLANDAGPIAYTPIDNATIDHATIDHTTIGDGAELSDLDRAIELFAAAGLLDDPPTLVEPAEFERVDLGEPAPWPT